jgi:glycosyltransferase involved in cell wall biosynthesis
VNISVVIPLYNKRPYIMRAISSVLSQTHPANEILVVDDGSTDGSREVVLEFKDSRIRLITQPNRGVSAARNRGVEAASNPLVAFLDADDEWLPCFLGTIARLAKNHPECGAFATAYDIKEVWGVTTSPRFNGIPPLPWEGVIDNFFCAVQVHPPFCSSTVCVQKTVLTEVGMFPIGERLGEDLDTWCRIALAYPIAFSTLVCGMYRRDANNRACTQNLPPHNYILVDTLDSAIAKMVTKQITSERFSINELSECKYKIIINSAAANVVAGQRQRARDLLAGASQTHAFKFSWIMWFGLSWFPSSLLSFVLACKRKLTKRSLS